MPAQWSTFIGEVSDILEIPDLQPLDAKDFGKKLAKAYLTAVQGNAQCIPGMANHKNTDAASSTFIAITYICLLLAGQCGFLPSRNVQIFASSVTRNQLC